MKVRAEGVLLHYLERGESDRAPVLVLLHGAGLALNDFELSLMDRLAHRYRVLAFDRPGYGLSQGVKESQSSAEKQALILDRALEALGVRDFIWVGHSFGALVALAHAILFPGKARALSLIAGYYFPSLRPEILFQAALAMPGIGPLIRYTWGPPMSALKTPLWLQQIFAPDPVPGYYYQRFPLSLLCLPEHLRAQGQDWAALIPSANHLSARYSEIQVPVKILAGENDLITHPDFHATRLKERIPGAELRLIKGTGHMLHHRHAKEVCAEIDLTARQLDFEPFSARLG